MRTSGRPRGGAGAAAAVGLAMVAAAIALSGCGGKDSGTKGSPARSTVPFTASDTLPATPLRSGTLLATKGTAVYRAAADRHHLVWETGPVEEEDVPTALHQRDLPGGGTVRLARNIYPAYGLASTRGWVVYSEGDGGRLIAVSHDASHRIVLSPGLVAPIAARGELVAWGEQTGATQRVVVRNMSTGAEWVAAQMRRCEHGHCYQIGAVTLADRGVAFTRDTSGPDMSFIVRRAYSAPGVSSVKIPGDPQPDLVPSSAGAVYYALNRGWYRWDFGQERPVRARFRTDPPAQVLGYDRGRWYMLTRRGCESGVTSRDQSGRRTVLAAPSTVTAAAGRPRRGKLCVELGSLVWTRRQALTAWAVAPRESEEEHTDIGIAGVVRAAGRK